MQHQDYKQITIGNSNKKPLGKNIISKNNIPDLHAIKVENETENFSIPTIPKALSLEISTARNTKKLTQKDMAIKLNIQRNVYNDIESSKALYNGKTKEIVNKIQKIKGIKFEKK